MPATYAHLMIADKALDQFRSNNSIGRNLRGQTLTHSHFVHLGSVGPDYPYLDFLQPNQKKWADHMHYDYTGDSIKKLADKLLEVKKQGMDNDDFIIPFCWALGYISHVTADLVVHPVVFNIVGPYEGHEPEHRHCEMIQDVYIYNKIRKGAEIEHSRLMEIVQNCSDPEDDDKIHPVLRDFWQEVLHTFFSEDYKENEPDIDEWHDKFEDWIGVAGDPPFVGRILDPNHKFTYKKSYEITDDERIQLLDKLPLPEGKTGTYEIDVFPKAVKHVLEKWTLISEGISMGNLDKFISEITNCDLDTGKDIKTLKLVYWE